MSAKLHIWIAALLLGPLCLAEPVNIVRKRVGVNFFGGFTFPNHHWNGEGSFSGVTGLAFGAGAEFKINPKWAVAVDVLHLNKSFIHETSGSQSRTSLTFVELPFRIRYHPAPWLSLTGGPYLASLLVAASRESNGVSTTVREEFSNDYGVTAGAGISFPVSKTANVGIDARYDLGLADVQNDKSPADSIRTRSIIAMFLLALTL